MRAMQPAQIEQAADELWNLAQRGQHYPDAWRGRMTVDDGYRVQLAILDRLIRAGERQVGWKVGLTSQSIRTQLGMHEPVFGFLLASGEKASGSGFRVADLITPLFETELCLTVDATLRGPGVTPAQARRVIVAAAPAFELVERRGDFVRDPAQAMVDNVQQKAFIHGAPRAPLPPGLALHEVPVEIVINGKSVDQAAGREVMGTPAASVAWLANRLAKFGRAVEPGMQIMSGSFTRQYPCNAGDRIEARFGGIGTVTARFD